MHTPAPSCNSQECLQALPTVLGSKAIPNCLRQQVSENLGHLLFLPLPLGGKKSPLKISSQNKAPTFHFKEFRDTRGSFVESLLTEETGLDGKLLSQPALCPLPPTQGHGDWRCGGCELGGVVGGVVGGGSSCPFWTSDMQPQPCIPSSPEAGGCARPTCRTSLITLQMGCPDSQPLDVTRLSHPRRCLLWPSDLNTYPGIPAPEARCMGPMN